MGFAFHDVELACAAIHAATFSLVGLVVVDLAAIHEDFATVDVNAAAVAGFGSVIVDAVAMDGDVAFVVVDAAAVQVGGVVLDAAGLGGGKTVAVAGAYHDVAHLGIDAAATPGFGLVVVDVGAIYTQLSLMVVQAAAVDVSFVAKNVTMLGEDAAFFEVDAAAAPGDVIT